MSMAKWDRVAIQIASYRLVPVLRRSKAVLAAQPPRLSSMRSVSISCPWLGSAGTG